MRRVLTFLLLALVSPAWAVRVEYTVMVRPQAKRFHVAMEVREDPDSKVAVAMPAWMPGYYRRLNQFEGVSNVAATVGGKPGAVQHPSPSTWQVAHAPDEAVRVEYDVAVQEYGFSAGYGDLTLGQIGLYAGRTSAYIHPGFACMYVDGHHDAPSTLRLALPRSWNVTAPLPRDKDGAFLAPDYDALNDSPIEAGAFRTLPFTARGRQFEIVLTGRCRVPDADLTDACRRIAAESIDLFHGYAPFETYQFHFHFPPSRDYAGAGLEHRNSCVIVFGSRMDAKALKLYAGRMIAHEFLHAWNVKALRPEGLGPFDYQRNALTPSLWVAEGVTDYYAHLVTVRAGIWTPEDALASISGLANDYMGSDGRSRTSLAESSLGVWDSENLGSNGSGGTNYYIKGLLAAWLLDIQVRADTNNRRSLDDAMRAMLAQYAEKGMPYPPDALKAAIRGTGADLDSAYDAYVHGTEDLPIAKMAALAGILAKTVQAPDMYVGVMLQPAAEGAVVKSVAKGSPADDAHITAGDLLLKIDDRPVRLGRPLLAGHERHVGDRVPLLIRRGTGEELVTLIVKGKPTLELQPDPNAAPAVKALRDSLWAPDSPTET